MIIDNALLIDFPAGKTVAIQVFFSKTIFILRYNKLQINKKRVFGICYDHRPKCSILRPNTI